MAADPNLDELLARHREVEAQERPNRIRDEQETQAAFRAAADKLREVNARYDPPPD